MKKFSFITIVFFLLFMPIHAHDNNTITFEQGVFIMTPAGTGAIYGKFTNHSNDDVMITNVRSPHAPMIELHKTVIKDDTATMQHLHHGLHIPAGKSVILKPKSFHIMVMKTKDTYDKNTPFTFTVKTNNGMMTRFDIPTKDISHLKTLNIK